MDEGGRSRTTPVMDRATGAHLDRFSLHLEHASCVDWSADGKTLVAGFDDGNVLLWRSADGFFGPAASSPTHVLARPTHEAEAVNFSANGRYLLTKTRNDLQVWDVASGRLVSDRIRARNAALSPDGKLVACQGTKNRNNMSVWNAHTNACLAVMKCNTPVERILWSPDGKSLALMCEHWQFRNVPSGELRAELPGVQGPAAWSPDGKSFAVASAKEIRFYDPSSGSLIKKTDAVPEAVNSIAWSTDGERLAIAGKEKVYVLASETLEVQQAVAHASKTPFHNLYWIADNRKLIFDHGKRVLNLDSGTASSFTDRRIADGTFSPNGHWCAGTAGGATEALSGRFTIRSERTRRNG